MPLDPVRLRATPIPEIEHRYDGRDCVLYALGVGVGLDPMDEDELAYVDETRLRVQPTMANVLGYPGFWMRDPAYGLDWQRTVHGEHAVRLHRPLPTAGHVRGTSRITGLVDKGAGRGALIHVEREIRDVASGDLLATVAQTVFCRGDGGFGTDPAGEAPARPPHRLPDRDPDAVIELPTSPQTALIYRLSGDLNPLHASPAAARAAGFERPILHGLATFGFAGRALVRGLCGGQPARLRAMGGRFSSPVFPGETLRIELWRPDDGGRGSFRTRVAGRDAVVMDNGFVEVA